MDLSQALTVAAVVIRERLESQVAELRATWKREVKRLKSELKAFYDAIAEANAQLDAALATPWDAE